MKYPSHKVLPEPQSLLLPERHSSTAKLTGIYLGGQEKCGESKRTSNDSKYVDLLWVYLLKM